ncbi:MAG TPA: c-type cytochrome [Methylomirabilota bacterium]|nr:c-type cytochrome [Methylomirabilota bacterium]
MREMIARTVAILAVCVVAALSYLFARLHNAPAPSQPGASSAEVSRPADPGGDTNRVEAPASAEADTGELRQALERGREVYLREGCATCHSIAGAGNPRYPLHGTGSHWEPEELEAWITGTGLATEFLSPAVVRRKQRYQSLPEADLKAMVAYLSGL